MAGFDIKGISEKAAREADKTWNRTVGRNESNPEDRVSVGGDQPSDRERFLRSLVTNRTRRAIAGLMIAPFAVSAIYVGAKDFTTGGTRDLDSYEISDKIVKAPSVDTTVRGVSYMEMLETGMSRPDQNFRKTLNGPESRLPARTALPGSGISMTPPSSPRCGLT